jgi:hypothetical protein
MRRRSLLLVFSVPFFFMDPGSTAHLLFPLLYKNLIDMVPGSIFMGVYSG